MRTSPANEMTAALNRVVADVARSEAGPPAVDQPQPQPSEPSLIASSAEAFGDLANPYRRELLVHCYRMLGSIDDAEDAVQDAFVRAWHGRSTFQRAISFRAWLYRIATNACLDAIERRKRGPGRAEPFGVGPFPEDDDAADEPEAGPEARYDAHESISLAFTTVLQRLPPRQRAVLILRDVLSWHAVEVAGLLDLSVPAVNSTLHRARATMSRQYRPATGSAGHPPVLAPGSLRSLLDRYVRAWEAADIPGLIALLRDDAVLAMPPGLAFAGHDAIAAFLAESIFVEGRQIRLIAVRANGGPAFAAYARPGPAGPLHRFAVLLLEIDEGGVARIDAFREPDLIPRFGLPEELTG